MKGKRAMFLGVTLLLVVSLMLPFGCAKETDTVTPAPTEFKTFSMYGFSFFIMLRYCSQHLLIPLHPAISTAVFVFNQLADYRC